MIFNGASGQLVIEGRNIQLLRGKITSGQRQKLSESTPIDVIDLYCGKPSWGTPGYVRFVTSKSEEDPDMLLFNLENPLTLHIEGKESWKEFQKLEPILRSQISKYGNLALLHFNPLDLEVPKVKRTTVPKGWEEIFENILEILRATDLENYFQVFTVLAGEKPGPVILGFWRSPDRMWLEVLSETEVIATSNELEEAGWYPPEPEHENLGLNMEVEWSEDENESIAKLLTNTLKWFGLDPDQFVVQASLDGY